MPYYRGAPYYRCAVLCCDSVSCGTFLQLFGAACVFDTFMPLLLARDGLHMSVCDALTPLPLRMCRVSCVICRVSCIVYHLSCVMCHVSCRVSCVVWHVSCRVYQV